MNLANGFDWSDGIESEHHEICLMAIKFLGVVNGSQALGLSTLSVKDFTQYEFDLMSYLQTQMKKMATNKR